MADFNAFAPNYSAPADLLAGFHVPILLKGGRGGEGKGREVEEKRRGYPVFP